MLNIANIEVTLQRMWDSHAEGNDERRTPSIMDTDYSDVYYSNANRAHDSVRYIVRDLSYQYRDTDQL